MANKKSVFLKKHNLLLIIHNLFLSLLRNMGYALKITAGEKVDCKITLPVSKSICSRLLILDFLSGKEIDLCDDDCVDIKVLKNALRRVRQVCQDSQSGSEKTEALVLDVCDSGTAMRFLTAALATTVSAHRYILTGSDRLKKRPIGKLVDALRNLGADIEYEGEEGFLPISIRGKRLGANDDDGTDELKVEIDASESSQYVSALMLISPFLEKELRIITKGKVVSRPYIDLTREIIDSSDSERKELELEGDWTAASYWYEVMALGGGRVEFTNLNEKSKQGDSVVPGLFEQIMSNDGGCFDFTNNPDLFPTIAATCWALDKRFEYSGVENLKLKESDRLKVVNEQIERIEAFRRNPKNGECRINSHGDHRIAMAFAPLALRLPYIIIENADVVDKSYPRYWDDLRKAGFRIEEAG